MRIKSIRIQNFRSFKDETIEFSNYTCLIGPNGAGKSNVLCALNVFFRESENYPMNLKLLDEEDFHHGNTNEPIIITLTFISLNKEAQKDFGHYYRQNQLVVTINNISVTAVNVKSAESQIRDVDFAAESANFSKHNILAQSGSYAMSQANAIQQNVLSLLQ